MTLGPAEPVSNPTNRFSSLLSKLFFIIPIGVIGNILYTGATIDRASIASLMHFSGYYFIGALLLSVVPWFTGSLRLFLWSAFLGGKIRYRDAFRIVINAELGAAVSPPLIAGSAVKIGMLMQQGFTGGTALSLTVLESLEDCLFFIVMVPIALAFSSSWDLPVIRNSVKGLGHPTLWVFLAGICAVLCVFTAMVHMRFWGLLRRIPVLRRLTDRIRSSYGNFVATFRTIARDGKRIFALTMALTSFQWVCRYSIISLLLAGMGIPARPLLFMALQVLVFALMTFAPTPGGAGGAEAMFALLYRAFLPSGAIGLVTSVWRFITFYFLVLLAAVLALLFGMQSGAATKPRGEQGALA